MICICGAAPMGSNREACGWCKEYYELTSDFGRDLVDGKAVIVGGGDYCFKHSHSNLQELCPECEHEHIPNP